MDSGLERLWPQAEAGEAAIWVACLQLEEIALWLSESSGRGTEAVLLGEFSGIRAVLSLALRRPFSRTPVERRFLDTVSVPASPSL